MGGYKNYRVKRRTFSGIYTPTVAGNSRILTHGTYNCRPRDTFYVRWHTELYTRFHRTRTVGFYKPSRVLVLGVDGGEGSARIKLSNKMHIGRRQIFVERDNILL